jgi:hypothetical protein
MRERGGLRHGGRLGRAGRAEVNMSQALSSG